MSAADRHTAAAFRQLHAPGKLLILPNAWDAGSARVIEEAGAAAIATTSSGLGWAHGYPDGNALPPAILAAAVAEIARAVGVPISVDVEGGYSDEPAAVGEVVAAVVGAGAVGINIEDGSAPPALLQAKIEAAKSAAARAGVDVFVNARIDVYLKRQAPPEQALATVLERARLYRAAGADGIFVPALVDLADAGRIVAAIEPLPLNLLAWGGLPPAAALRTAGVRRLSAGGAIATASLGLARRLAASFLADGRSDALLGAGLDHASMQALLAAR